MKEEGKQCSQEHIEEGGQEFGLLGCGRFQQIVGKLKHFYQVGIQKVL